MNYDNSKLKDKIALIIIGVKILIDLALFENDLTEILNKDAALTVLIHLGYLSYDEKNATCYILNYEIKKEF